ncbi:MAG: VF530 family DNA-binding protein [Limisphaerales bacterium]
MNTPPPSAPRQHPRDPLHGITLEMILNDLSARHGWAEMGRRIPIRCFLFNPSVKSSLTFLRKTPWARKKVEEWFIWELPHEPASPPPTTTPPTGP